mgnify:CR=1 FL=1
MEHASYFQIDRSGDLEIWSLEFALVHFSPVRRERGVEGWKVRIYSCVVLLKAQHVVRGTVLCVTGVSTHPNLL